MNPRRVFLFLPLLVSTVVALNFLSADPAPATDSPPTTPLLAVTSVTTSTLMVDGQANIFGAGHATPPEPGGGGAGLLPPSVSFAAGSGGVVTFSDVQGSVSFGPFYWNGPDGGPGCCSGTDISSFGGISGIRHDKELFLVGVFLSNTEPTDPAPAVLDFTGASDFDELSPVLSQTFFVGDGLTGTGSGDVQRFNIPSGATRLFLGFADAGAFHGAPGVYGDNDGELEVTAQLETPPPTDTDGDGVPDASDLCPGTPAGATTDTNGCSRVQVDQDLDGVCDPGKTSSLCAGADACPDTPEDPDGFQDHDGCPEEGIDAFFCQSRQLLGCVIALDHGTTQELILIIDSTGGFQVPAVRQLCVAAIIGSPLAASACSVLAAEVRVFSGLFSRELKDQDRGNGVFITLGWPPGIVGQRDLP